MSLFKFITRIVVVFTTLCFVVFSQANIIAQNFDDDPLMLDGDDEFGFQQFEDDDYQSSGFDRGGIQDFGIMTEQDRSDSLEEQYESTDQYLDEGAFSEETESTLKDDLIVRRELLSQEGKDAPSNLGYGAGTGLMMGTWFAFIRKETNTRQQFRTIGTSTVIGAVVGIMLGTRSVWIPGAPRPEESSEPTGFMHTPAGWFLAQKEDSLLISYQWRF
ncbi:MAG: hypothetical protein MAG581_01119 [Deltaproteobacteria bacterium]|jgi:hypothetical protein|nr:hypothetical protein [Deltaproteobacteria bacterium]